MMPFFSASRSEVGDPSSIAEIQLLADQELMSLWEQTQMAAATIEARGGSAATAHRYEAAVLLELQKRLAALPSGHLFGRHIAEDALPADNDAAPHIMVVRA